MSAEYIVAFKLPKSSVRLVVIVSIHYIRSLDCMINILLKYEWRDSDLSTTHIDIFYFIVNLLHKKSIPNLNWKFFACFDVVWCCPLFNIFYLHWLRSIPWFVKRSQGIRRVQNFHIIHQPYCISWSPAIKMILAKKSTENWQENETIMRIDGTNNDRGDIYSDEDVTSQPSRNGMIVLINRGQIGEQWKDDFLDK